MQLSEKENSILNNFENGNLTEFKNDLKGLSKKELISFIYNVQEQSILSPNEILSICYKYA